MAKKSEGSSPLSAKADSQLKDIADVQRWQEQSQIDFDVEFFDKILSRSPGYVDVLSCQAQLLSRVGEHARALEMDRRLVELRPHDCIAQYNLACSLALQHQVREAVDSLQRALELGYSDFDHLENDRDLDVLRGDAGFRRLVRKFGLNF